MANSGTLYMLLIAAIAVTFYLQIEFLYLALIAVLILLVIADRQPAQREYEPQPLPENEMPSGPVVIQQAPYSPAHDFVNDLVTNVTQQVMDSEPRWSGGRSEEISGEISSLRDEVRSLRKQLDKDKKK